MRINVTWSDVRAGRAAKTMECMVALALKRELGVDYASVGYQSATIRLDGQYAKIYLPQEVQNKIRSWDRSQFVLPFSFELSSLGLFELPRRRFSLAGLQLGLATA
jgi:hypothetical protein